MLIAVLYLAWSTSVRGRYALRPSRMIAQKRAYDFVWRLQVMWLVSFLGSLGNWMLGTPLLTAKENLPFSWIRTALGPWWTRDVWLTIQRLRNWRRVQKCLTTLPNKNFVNTMQKRPCIFAGIKKQISFKLGLWFLPDLYVYFSLILIPSDLQVPLLHCTSSTVTSLLAIILIATEMLTIETICMEKCHLVNKDFYFFFSSENLIWGPKMIYCVTLYIVKLTGIAWILIS